MFEGITKKLQSVFRLWNSRGRLTEKNIKEGIREIKMALLEADVNYKVVKNFIDEVTKKAIGTDVLKSITPTQQLIKIVNDELIHIMGPVDHNIKFDTIKPTVFMMIGLQGSGKTTTCAKFANYLRRKGKRPLMVAADVRRAAAIEQLEILGNQIDIPVYSEKKSPPSVICYNSLKFAEQNLCDCIILDTAGRLHIDEPLMNELKNIIKKISPHYKFLVADAMTGQDAVNSSKEFNNQLNIDAVILTKLDGDARGGAALSIKSVTNKPILFAGTGEKIDNFEEFHPDRMASRILGMGDVVSLVEKAKEAIDEEQARKLEEKLRKNTFTFQDFLDQIQQIKKMGPLKEIISMLPGGLGQMAEQFDEYSFKHLEAIILSMTPEERLYPEIINGSRRRRIARGSGTSIQEVNSLLKQFKEMRKMMKKMKGFQKMFGKFGKFFPGFK